MVGCQVVGIFGVSEKEVLSRLVQRLGAVTLLKQRLPQGEATQRIAFVHGDQLPEFRQIQRHGTTTPFANSGTRTNSVPCGLFLPHIIEVLASRAF